VAEAEASSNVAVQKGAATTAPFLFYSQTLCKQFQRTSEPKAIETGNSFPVAVRVFEARPHEVEAQPQENIETRR
jgi:hypothetical protein